MPLENNDILDNIKRCFEEYIEKGLFNRDFIGPKYEYYSGRRCHSRVLGMLIHSIQGMGYITDIERSIQFKQAYKPLQKKRAMHQYRPDITIVNNNDEIIGIVEYETIDASTEHLSEKIEYFRNAIPANPTLQFLIFFPTLTTLQSRPNKWIEKDRQIYVEPLSKELQKLSKENPNIEIY